MPREVLSIGLGQCGLQLGQAVWAQYTEEHEVDPDGTKRDDYDDGEGGCSTFFEESSNGKLVPRNLFVDLEENCIDDIKNGTHGSMFNPNFLLSGTEDAANNFARGHYTVGREMIGRVDEALRQLSDCCDSMQGFLINHSVGGGTGSGMGALLLERLAVNYTKKSRVGFNVYPSNTISNCIVAPYNALLSTHWSLNEQAGSGISMVLDNEAAYRICNENLDIKDTCYDNVNRLIAKAISSVTVSMRFAGEQSVTLNGLYTSLVPFPRIHFMTNSIAPIISKAKASNELFTCQDVCDAAVDPSNFLVNYPDFDEAEDKYVAIAMLFRGTAKPTKVSKSIQWLTDKQKLSFVDWCPTGFLVGLNDTPAALVDDDDMAGSNINCSMIGNNVAVSRVFSERIVKKFDMMFSQRSFVHWYIGEGMEEGEFFEARENLGFLEKDYLDILSGGSDADSDEFSEEF